MYPRVPNMTTPTINPATVVKVKFRSENNDRGITGSFTFDSVTMNAMTPTIVTRARPMICGESQSYCWPPHVQIRMSVVVANVRSTMPR